MRVFERHPVVRLAAKLLLVSVPLLGYAVREELRLRRLPTSYARKREVIERRGRDAQVVVLGHSEAFQGIKPSELGCRALNLANTSQSIYYDVHLVLRYLRDMPRLRLVVLPISYFSLRYTIPDSEEPWRGFLYALYYGIPNEDPSVRRWALRNHSFLLNFADLRSFGLAALPGGVPAGAVPVDDDGWFEGSRAAATSAEGLSDSKGLERVRRHETVMKEPNLAFNVASLEALLGEVKRRGVAAVFVTLPVHRSYSAGMTAQAYEEMQATLLRLGGNHGVEYANYLFDRRFTDEDFEDPNHLSVRGAVRFSRILRDEVLSRYLDCARRSSDPK